LQQEEDIPALLEIGTLADALGIPYVRIFGGGHEGEAMGNAEIRSVAGIYSKLQARWESQELAARLLVETHGGLVTSKAIKAFDEATGGEVLYLWDSHHTWKSGGDAPEQTAALIGPRVRHIHCKDSIPAAERRSGYRYVLPGAGGFPFRELLRAMQYLDPATALSLEWEKQWHPELTPVDGALEAFLATVATMSGRTKTL
jgi:sugar phosphate isomerase/epimerase